MKSGLGRRTLFWWWLASVPICFLLAWLVAAVVRQPPFSEWSFIAAWSLLMPSVLVPAFNWLFFTPGRRR